MRFTEKVSNLLYAGPLLSLFVYLFKMYARTVTTDAYNMRNIHKKMFYDVLSNWSKKLCCRRINKLIIDNYSKAPKRMTTFNESTFRRDKEHWQVLFARVGKQQI